MVIQVPQMTQNIVPLSRKGRGYGKGGYVDIVGVTSSILVTPTILFPVNATGYTFLRCSEMKYSTGSPNLKGASHG